MHKQSWWFLRFGAEIYAKENCIDHWVRILEIYMHTSKMIYDNGNFQRKLLIHIFSPPIRFVLFGAYFHLGHFGLLDLTRSIVFCLCCFYCHLAMFRNKACHNGRSNG